MRSPLLLVFFLSALSALGIIHVGAIYFSLYWKYPWLDIPVHALGGLVVMLGIFLVPLFNLRLGTRWFTFFPLMACVLGIGILWELFEISIGMPLFEEGFYLDMLIDLAMDLTGGALGYGLIQSMKKL